MSTRVGAGTQVGANGEEPTVASLLSSLSNDASHLLRQEVELAKAEVREEARRAAKGGGMLGAAGVLGHTAMLLLAFALAWALAAVLQPGLAFLIVGVVFAAAAGVLGVAGRRRLQAASPVPEQTLDTVEEDMQWARDRTR